MLRWVFLRDGDQHLLLGDRESGHHVAECVGTFLQDVADNLSDGLLVHRCPIPYKGIQLFRVSMIPISWRKNLAIDALQQVVIEDKIILIPLL